MEAAQALNVSIVTSKAVFGPLLDDMFGVFRDHYDGVDKSQFERDLGAKDEVFLIRSGAKLAGFSTLSVARTTFDGAPVRVAFSGDTVVDRRFWGSPAFSFAWVRRMGEIAAAAPEPLYWLLIVKGWRTYRYLGTFGLEFVPDWRRRDDGRLLRMRDRFAQERFGDAYDPPSGLVRFPRSRGHLRQDCAIPSRREAARPDVAFFLARNPGYAQGDELACLCELSAANMRPLTRRLFAAGAP